jgi:hypothetical protein
MATTYKGKASDLGFGHLGFGITVWDRSRQRNNDYETVALIGPDRKVKYRALPLSEEQTKSIEDFAKICDSNISATQTEKVFTTPPQQ